MGGWGEGGQRRGRHKKNLEEQKEDRGLACLEKTVTVGPRGGRQTWLIPHLELVDRNLMLALTSQHQGGGLLQSCSTGNMLPTFFMSNTSLCVTCHLRDTLTSPPLSTSHAEHIAETPLQKHKQTRVHILTDCLSCLPLGQ